MNKDLLLYKEKIEKEKYLNDIKKIMVGVFAIFAVNFILNNHMFLNYKINQDDYKLYEAKIEEILRGRPGSFSVSISYNFGENIYYELKLPYNLGDHEGDIITVIEKDGKIGRHQIVVDWLTMYAIAFFGGLIIIYFITYSQLKKQNIL